jgi:hypothetical protein
MTPRLTTLRTALHYSLARLCVLLTTRTVWSTLIMSSILVLAIIGTSAAWRARHSGEESLSLEHALSVSPLAEIVPQTTDPSETQGDTVPSNASPAPMPTATDTRSVALSEDVPNPFTNTSLGDERTQRISDRGGQATQHQLTMSELDVKIAERHKELARLSRDTDAMPPRAARPTPSPSIPRVQVISISSTAALIQQHGWRQIVHRGMRLNGWTIARLAPTGITLRRAQRQAFLPLAFGLRSGGTR